MYSMTHQVQQHISIVTKKPSFFGARDESPVPFQISISNLCLVIMIIDQITEPRSSNTQNKIDSGSI